MPGLRVTRPLRTPADLDGPAAARPAWVALTTDDDRRGGCTLVGERPLCASVLPRPGEEEAGVDRVVALPVGGDYRRSVTVEPRPGDALDRAARGHGHRDSAWRPRRRRWRTREGRRRRSPTATSARDGSAAPGDDDPTLDGPAPGGPPGERPAGPGGPGARRVPRAVRHRAHAGGPAVGEIGPDGTVLFRAVTTDRLDVTFPVVVPLPSYNPYTRATTFQPVGLCELRVLGADDLRERRRRRARGRAVRDGPRPRPGRRACAHPGARRPARTSLAGRPVPAGALRTRHVTSPPATCASPPAAPRPGR